MKRKRQRFTNRVSGMFGPILKPLSLGQLRHSDPKTAWRVRTSIFRIC